MCRGGEVGRGEAGPLGSAPQRQALALTHGPGIGEWREGRTHPGKVGARARCMCFGWVGGVGEEQFSSTPSRDQCLGHIRDSVTLPPPSEATSSPWNTPYILSSHLPTGVMLTWSPLHRALC